MITQVSCPACQCKVSIPEGDMGKRQICSNCKSPFIAGASVTEPRIARTSPLGAAPTYAQTMLAGTAPPIKYNCPRCQAPLEAPSLEAGTKKPCPACGQRLQVPAAPPPPAAAPQPNLNKTMLAGDGSSSAAPPIKYNCPGCQKRLESPASEAGIKKPCPACGQRLQIPAASPLPPQRNPNKTMLASNGSSPQPTGGQPGHSTSPALGAPPTAPAPAPGGQITIGSLTMSTRTFVIGAVAAGLFLLFIGQAVVRGGKVDDPAAAAAREREIAKANEEVEQKKARLDDYNKALAEMRAKLDRQEDQIRENHREEMRRVTDDRVRAELRDKQESDKAKWDREKLESEKQYQLKLAELKAEAEKAQRVQQTIIQQPPPPPVYYPPYHWRYYSPWGW